MANQHIGIIGAGGWLGGALARSLVKTGFCEEHNLTLSFRSKRPDFLTGAEWTDDNARLTERSDVIILSVRPHDFPVLHLDVANKLIISLMAGVSLERLADRLKSKFLVRALPNAAIEVQKSYTPWIASEAVEQHHKDFVTDIFDAVGEQDELSDERHIDYFAGSTGTGPAYAALLFDILKTDAVAQGIAPETAERAMRTLLIGSAALVEAKPPCFSEIVEDFIAYNGMTAAALQSMKDNGLADVVANGIKAGLDRAKTFDT